MKIFECILLLMLAASLSFISFEVGYSSGYFKQYPSGKIRIKRKNWAGWWPLQIMGINILMLPMIICSIMSVLGKDVIFINIITFCSILVCYEYGFNKLKSQIPE